MVYQNPIFHLFTGTDWGKKSNNLALVQAKAKANILMILIQWLALF